MKVDSKKNLFVLDIDDTLTKSESNHVEAYTFAMRHFGIKHIDENWNAYKHHTDSYILKKNYESNLESSFQLSFIDGFETKMAEHFLSLKETVEIKGAAKTIDFIDQQTNYAICFATGSLLKPAFIKLIPCLLLKCA